MIEVIQMRADNLLAEKLNLLKQKPYNHRGLFFVQKTIEAAVKSLIGETMNPN